MNKKTELATFGGGCFWCTEAVFTQLKGVLKVTSGFTGGSAETAHYYDVCSGQTDHVGPQYRSAIFYHNQSQKQNAEQIIKEVETSTGNTIVTSLEKYDAFYQADESHQQYFEKDPLSPYCQVVIIPKMIKLRSEWKDWLK